MSRAVPPKWVLLYECEADVLERAPDHYPAHSARVEAFHERGDLLLVGLFANPQADGSMAVFRTRESAEEFAAADPFVVNGVVRSYRLLQWNEIYGGDL